MPKKDLMTIRVTIMSIGGRGANVMERIAAMSLPGVRLVGVGARGKTFDRLVLREKIELSGRGITEKQFEIKAVVEQTDILFLLGNVAGEESAAQCDEVAKIARKCGALTFFVGAFPFAFEGRPKLRIAEDNVAMLNQSVDGVLTVDGGRLLAAGTNAQDALTKTDQVVASMIRNIVDLVMKFGVVNVDFSDLKTTVENAGEIFFNAVTVPRAEISTVASKLLSETALRQSARKLTRALYVIYGSADLLMEEISLIGQKIVECTSDDARIIFGVVAEGEREDGVKVVLIGA